MAGRPPRRSYSDFAAAGFVGAGAGDPPLALRREAQARLDLPFHLLAQRREKVAHVEGEVLVGQVLPAEVARVEQLQQDLHDLQDLDARGQEAAVCVLGPRVAAVARQHPLHESRQHGRRAHGFAGEADIDSTSAKRPS